jgi:hypothetical protein
MATASLQQPAILTHQREKELKVIMHTGLLYWWPVWVVGFLMAVWTALDDYHMILVPDGTTIAGNTLTVPDGATMDAPLLHVSRSKLPGILFAVTLALVVGCSGGWMRGWRAYFFAATVVALVLLLSWAGLWGSLYDVARYLDIRINLGGYLVLSTVLFLIWTWFFFFVDRQVYVVFSKSQIRIHNRILEEERAFDAGGVAFQVREYDWFRWLVGGGAGDIVLRLGGSPQPIELPNVLRVGRRLNEIEKLLRTRDVD